LPFTDLLQGISKSQVEQVMARSFLKDPVETSVNAFLINTGQRLVLIDAGAGNLFGPTLGRLPAALKAAGYQPEQVDEIYISHMHGDHVGGLMVGGKIAFPNAIVRADRAEGEFWLSKEKMAAAKKEEQPAFQGAMAMVGPYAAAGRYKSFDGDTELSPGIRSIVTRGHTPGHAIYVIESKGQKLVLWGDLMHQAAVQFTNPAVTIAFDTDQATAAKQRERAFDMAAREGHWVGASHLPFPGIGHLRSEAQGYSYVPVNYSALP
jgi:glyoxylase-like metal-dependent hydrolase (beta-lactamase superfamily II)